MRTLYFVIILLAHNTMLCGNIIKGQIIDAENDEPLIGATIIYLDDITQGTSSDMNGMFELPFLESDKKIELLFQYIGYDEHLLTIDPANVSELIIVRLSQKDQLIEEVVIAASPAIHEEFIVKELSKLDIYTNPNSRADPIRAINSLPSATNVEESANLSLRGSPANETAYVLNGVPIDDVFKLDQSNGIGQFSIFNTSIISKVEVFPSNPPLNYGSSTSGLVALQTDNGSAINANSMNITLAGLGFKMDRKLSNEASLVSYFNATGHEGLTWLNPQSLANLKSTRSLDIGNYFTYQFNESSRLKIFNYTLIENYEYLVDRPEVSSSSFQSKKRNLSVINYEKSINEHIRLGIDQGLDFSNSSYTLGNTTHEGDIQNFFSALNLRRSGDFYTFQLGLSSTINRQKLQGRYAIYHWANQQHHPSQEYNQDQLFLMPEINTYNKFRFSDNIILSIANRRTLATSDNLDDHSSDQVNLTYGINEQQKVKLSFGKYSRYYFPGIRFQEATLVSARQYSLDYAYSKNRFDLAAALYTKRASYPDRAANIWGFELFGEYSSSNFNTSLSFSHIKVNMDNGETKYPGRHDLDFFIRHLMKFDIGDIIELSSVLLIRSGAYVTPVISSDLHSITDSYQPIYAEMTNRIRLPQYSTWDLSLSKIFELSFGSMVAFVSSSNVWNKNNAAAIEYDDRYNQIGYTQHSKRVFFAGMVFNW